jgi:hypothetical protein
MEGSSSPEVYLDIAQLKAGILYIGVEQNGSSTFYKIIKN